VAGSCLDSNEPSGSLKQCFLTAGPRPGNSPDFNYTGPSSYKKIYRASVSERLRTTAFKSSEFLSEVSNIQVLKDAVR
jgi:hypothetical protein